MPKRSSKKKASKGKERAKRDDANQTAAWIVQEATKEEKPGDDSPPTTPDGKNAAAVALGRLGGKKGGPARAKLLTPKQRSEIARRAAQARWKK